MTHCECVSIIIPLNDNRYTVHEKYIIDHFTFQVMLPPPPPPHSLPPSLPPPPSLSLSLSIFHDLHVSGMGWDMSHKVTPADFMT